MGTRNCLTRNNGIQVRDTSNFLAKLKFTYESTPSSTVQCNTQCKAVHLPGPLRSTLVMNYSVLTADERREMGPR